jgi:hypothetical protein
MARLTEEQGGESQLINFVVDPPLPGIVRAGKQERNKRPQALSTSRTNGPAHFKGAPE